MLRLNYSNGAPDCARHARMSSFKERDAVTC
jgi:hypothetical protein